MVLRVRKLPKDKKLSISFAGFLKQFYLDYSPNGNYDYFVEFIPDRKNKILKIKFRREVKNGKEKENKKEKERKPDKKDKKSQNQKT